MINRNKLIEAINTAEVETLEIEKLVFDKNSYSRTGGIDRNAVEDYSRNIASMPPIVINQDNIIVDGVHRYNACLKTNQQAMKVRRIDLPKEDIRLANLLIDIHSGVRHPIEDKKSIVVDLYDPQNSEQNKLLMDELDVPERTFYDWTSKKRSIMKKQVNFAMAIDLLNPNLSQQEIADRYGCHVNTIKSYKKELGTKIAEIAKIVPDELIEADLDFLIDYKKFIENDLFIYNIWNKSKGDDNSYFGHFPKSFMKNLLYYHTQPFGLVYDPFAGSGTTIDACRETFRQCVVSDRKPDKSRPEIFEHDIKDGLPGVLPKPDLVFLDPPYWKQAEGVYSDSPDDLGNMDLSNFYTSIQSLLTEIAARKIDKIALVIQPTQYKNNFVWEDHIFKINSMLTDKYEIEMRYILPYSTQQYNAQMVESAKERNACLGLNRDLVIWRTK